MAVFVFEPIVKYHLLPKNGFVSSWNPSAKSLTKFLKTELAAHSFLVAKFLRMYSQSLPLSFV